MSELPTYLTCTFIMYMYCTTCKMGPPWKIPLRENPRYGRGMWGDAPHLRTLLTYNYLTLMWGRCLHLGGCTSRRSPGKASTSSLHRQSNTCRQSILLYANKKNAQLTASAWLRERPAAADSARTHPYADSALVPRHVPTRA